MLSSNTGIPIDAPIKNPMHTTTDDGESRKGTRNDLMFGNAYSGLPSGACESFLVVTWLEAEDLYLKPGGVGFSEQTRDPGMKTQPPW